VSHLKHQKVALPLEGERKTKPARPEPSPRKRALILWEKQLRVAGDSCSFFKNGEIVSGDKMAVTRGGK